MLRAIYHQHLTINIEFIEPLAYFLNHIKVSQTSHIIVTITPKAILHTLIYSAIGHRDQVKKEDLCLAILMKRAKQTARKISM